MPFVTQKNSRQMVATCHVANLNWNCAGCMRTCGPLGTTGCSVLVHPSPRRVYHALLAGDVLWS